MIRPKTSLIRFIRFWGLIVIMGSSAGIIAHDIYLSHQNLHARMEEMRTRQIDSQKQIIRREVNRVIDIIKHKKEQSIDLANRTIKKRVYEAYAIAQNIYLQNRGIKNSAEIQQMIINALSPIRFKENTGYYFINRLDGTAILSPDNPSSKNENNSDVQQDQRQHIARNISEIVNRFNEGFYTYFWTKPGAAGNSYKKVSFIKKFKPYDWVIGAGLYVADVEEAIKKDLLSTISRIRFGKEGYIFINRLNGDALVSNGKLISGTKKLWDVFNKDPEKMKGIFQKEYDAALKPDGDYIYYSINKLTVSDKESPKISFIRGIPDLKWIVGAGAYLDDIENEINQAQTRLNKTLQQKMFHYFLIVAIIICFFLILFRKLNKKFENDFNVLISLFNRAAHSDTPIDRDRLQFDELDRMAENANVMLSDKILASKSLLAEREQLFVTIRSIGDGVITTDTAGGVVLMNRVAEQLTGWQTEEARGKSLNDIFKIVNSKTREKVENPVSHVLQSGQTIDLGTHTMLISRDGVEYQVADSAAPIRDAAGKITGVVLVFRDETNAYHLRENLRQSEANLRTIFEAAKDVGFVKTDCCMENLEIIQFSPGAQHIFGYTQQNVIGHPIEMLCHQQDGLDFSNITKKLNDFRNGISGETTLVRKNGESFPALFTIYPVFNDKGDLVETLAVFIDITKRKMAEEELLKVDKLKSIGTLAGGIAHDFNNVLMGLFGNIAIAREKLAMDHPAFPPLEEAGNSMNRAILLTRQLLTFAKGGAPVKESLSLENLVEEIIRFDLSGSNVKPVFAHAENLWPADVDKGQIQQVFSNLAINARQAMPEGGHLYLKMENAEIPELFMPGLRPGKYIKIMVTDEGTGIDRKYYNRIFDPYFTTKHTGSGLGLATVHSIINKHGGTISVDSTLGKGTTFTFYLPASESRKLLETGKSDNKENLDATQTAKILVMDDEEMIREVVTAMLESLGYIVETATGGKQAADKYRHAMAIGQPFDVIIMDLTIPGGVGGEDAIRDILKIDPNAKCIVSSGYADDPVMANYAEYGFYGIVAKPYTQKDLQEVLIRVLEKT